MATCLSCDSQIPDDSQFCPQCGQAVPAIPQRKEPVAGAIDEAAPDAFGPTVTSPRERAPANPAYDSSYSSSSDSIDDARFTPGTMLLDRYRIVGLLGKGGMGEVYRADDLKLRQPVALKFLPETLAKNQSRLDRFHHEVRVARQVSHPNVCRVYDIGEADGHPFITMEYVSGEDLASVLRRMGRPSGDKALQIARQICAGLAAAHDKGVLHRDLKPHNIMIDERGRVRITDFGLAGFIEEFTGKELQAGTPAYMSPEQIAGKEVSVKSDLYSLGLVLFELFTGKRAFTGNTKDELLTNRSQTNTSSFSTQMDGVESSIERVILRCIEEQPAARPSSAMAVAAALPGGDPLAAALAAGETPDPSMVAAAGGVGGLKPSIALLCLFGTLVFAFIYILTNRPLLTYESLDKPPEVLADRAQEIVKQLGYETPVLDRFMDYIPTWNVLSYVKENDKDVKRWEKFGASRIPCVCFFYRQSPLLLIPGTTEDYVQFNDPPLIVSGMSNVLLDPAGRLLQYITVPPELDQEKPEIQTPTPWSTLFELADIDESNFKRVESIWNPIVYCDERAAWEGHITDLPEIPIRIEAGAYRGKPNYFRIFGPWTKAILMEEDTVNQGLKIIAIIAQIILWSVVISSILIARRNLQLKRGDRAGATRFAIVFFLMTLSGWLLTTLHVPSIWPEFRRIFHLVGSALTVSATIWLLYIALEPYVRRYWPHVLISWNRLLAGKWRDPLVGRDILIGAFFSMFNMILARCKLYLLMIQDIPPDIPQLQSSFAYGIRGILGRLVDPAGMWVSFFILFILFIARLLFKRQWLAVFIVLALFSLPQFVRLFTESDKVPLLVDMISGIIGMGIFLFTMIRFGLLAVMSSFLLVGLVERNGVTFDLSSWYGGQSMFMIAVFVILVVYSFYISLAGRSLFKDDFLDT